MRTNICSNFVLLGQVFNKNISHCSFIETLKILFTLQSLGKLIQSKVIFVRRPPCLFKFLNWLTSATWFNSKRGRPNGRLRPLKEASIFEAIFNIMLNQYFDNMLFHHGYSHIPAKTKMGIVKYWLFLHAPFFVCQYQTLQYCQFHKREALCQGQNLWKKNSFRTLMF